MDAEAFVMVACMIYIFVFLKQPCLRNCSMMLDWFGLIMTVVAKLVSC